ncbi:hypothetical protein CF327_g4642 [Tilletia walkeri]|nr:hypothetical protein CF327_g4642 [Tilletia walkeri]
MPPIRKQLKNSGGAAASSSSTGGSPHAPYPTRSGRASATSSTSLTPASTSTPFASSSVPAPAGKKAAARDSRGGSSSGVSAGGRTIKKREVHNAIERDRRNRLNDRFLDLAAKLPATASVRRPSKNLVISKSIQFVNDALQQEIVYRGIIEKLFKDNAAMREEVNGIRTANGIELLPPQASGQMPATLVQIGKASHNGSSRGPRTGASAAALVRVDGADDDDDDDDDDDGDGDEDEDESQEGEERRQGSGRNDVPLSNPVHPSPFASGGVGVHNGYPGGASSSSDQIQSFGFEMPQHGHHSSSFESTPSMFGSPFVGSNTAVGPATPHYMYADDGRMQQQQQRLSFPHIGLLPAPAMPNEHHHHHDPHHQQQLHPHQQQHHHHHHTYAGESYVQPGSHPPFRSLGLDGQVSNFGYVSANNSGLPTAGAGATAAAPTTDLGAGLQQQQPHQGHTAGAMAAFSSSNVTDAAAAGDWLSSSDATDATARNWLALAASLNVSMHQQEGDLQQQQQQQGATVFPIKAESESDSSVSIASLSPSHSSWGGRSSSRCSTRTGSGTAAGKESHQFSSGSSASGGGSSINNGRRDSKDQFYFNIFANPAGLCGQTGEEQSHKEKVDEMGHFDPVAFLAAMGPPPPPPGPSVVPFV